MTNETQRGVYLCPMCELPTKGVPDREIVEVMPKEPSPLYREYAPGDVTYYPCRCVRRRQIG
jgi:hypothetical protein